MRTLTISLVLSAATVFAQYQAVPGSSNPALDAILNGKLAFTTGSGVPAGPCTQGKDVYTNTARGAVYWCSARDTWTMLPFLASFAPVATSGNYNDLSNKPAVATGSLPTASGSSTISTPLISCLDRTVTFSADLAVASQVASVILGTLPAHWIFTDVWVRESVTFASPLITSMTASIGPAGSETAILPAVGLKQTANTVAAFVPGYAASDSATAIIAQFIVTAGGGNLNTLTAGTWDLRVCGHAGR